MLPQPKSTPPVEVDDSLKLKLVPFFWEACPHFQINPPAGKRAPKTVNY